ncbi:MAG: hypothetical protein FI699_09790 [SAR202 cluster bacterium]|nr:hypothetical protein [SAR202 cluster bacterium]|tara:strand:- start:1063 stop:2298 length:1236 start_codon:yes stop_codon:yes gene_type:complete
MKSGDIFALSKNGDLQERFERYSLSAGGHFDEKWLQEVLFANIELIQPTDASYDKLRLIPLCRELNLNDGIRNLYLDILTITETGKLILIECKLWKNPQARREVLAQAFEYASLLQSLSYSDLSSKLRKHIDSGTEDPIVFALRSAGISVDESLLISRVDQGIKKGNFHIVIAGDGIRTDLVNLVNSPAMTGMTADLSLLEISVHQNTKGEILLSPSVPQAIETITRTVLISTEGMPVSIEEDESEVNQLSNQTSPAQRQMNEEKKELNTLFWQRAINEINFSHPDQEPLRRGGSNWCKALLPAPLKWITAWRGKDQIGVFLRIDGDDIRKYGEFFTDQLELMKAEISQDITIGTPEDGKSDWSTAFFIMVETDGIDLYDPATTEHQIDWLGMHLDKFVNYMRPLVKQLPK